MKKATRPDHSVNRKDTACTQPAEASFNWWVGGGIEALSVLAGVRFHRLFKDLDAIVESFRKGSRIAREMFGPEVPFGSPRWASIG